ncbi:MAG: ATP-binding protein [Acidobacteriota bacterium]|nr:ATP-binding protein [Blastocatellia bacterium]MDW8413550.1 ATP-binding protein [Acidobacteriota bacterium]
MTDCLQILTTTNLELGISPEITLFTEAPSELKHLSQYQLELSKISRYTKKLPHDEWFTISYGEEFSFILLVQTEEKIDYNKLCGLIAYEPAVVVDAINWLSLRYQLPISLNKVLTKPQKAYYAVLSKFSTNVNLLPNEQQRIEQEMEATLYKLALSNSELAVLNTMLELISRSLDLKEIYEGLLKAVALVDIESVIILLDEGKRLNIDFWGGTSLEVAEATRSIAGESFYPLREKLLEISTAYVDQLSSQFPKAAEALIKAGVQTAVFVPLHSRDSTIGFMILPLNNYRKFSSDDLRLFTSIGSQVGLAIEAARLYENSQRLARQMAALFEVGKTISAHLELQPLFSSIAENAAKLLDADQTAVVILDRNSKAVVTTAEWHSKKPPTKANLLSFAQTKASAEVAKPTIESYEGSSIISCPIVVSERISPQHSLLGSLCALRSTKEKSSFKDADLELLANLISQVAVAIENAELYSKILETNAQLREAIRLKDEIVSMVAHDFRSPLTSIQAFSEILHDRIDNPEYKRYLAIINRQSKHLASLAADTLTMSRLESGSLPFKFTKFKLNELITSIIENRAATDTNADIKVELPEEDIEIVGDQGRLYEVIDNLVGNAIKYSPDGASVKIKLTKVNDSVQVSVSDRGMGISAEDIPKLFQKFSRLEAARQRQIAGTGLGLYICRCIIEAHKGSIWVESVKGKGSTFHFKLPSNLSPESANP